MPYKNKDQQRKFQREWKQARRAEFFTGKTCEWCGSVDNLQLHHRNPEEKETHRIWSFSKARRDAEIAKCIVLCWPCHIHYHVEQRRKVDQALMVETESEMMMMMMMMMMDKAFR